MTTTKAGRTFTFQTTDTQLAARSGQRAIVTRVYDDQHGREVLPVFMVRFEDGYEAEAFSDELHELADA